MNLPIRFPNPGDVLREEAARYRALPPKERVRELSEMVNLYYRLLDLSPRKEALTQYAMVEEERGRRAIEEFAARHG
jgi:hypothetical protein